MNSIESAGLGRKTILIKGARQHNLKNVDVEIPREKLVVITGISGSGKSSLAFDTLYAEGQRRYVESLSAYARQFLEQMEKPDVDSIDGLSPAIAIEQKAGSHNPRSTVATVTEIYDYLRLLFARVGKPHCHVCGRPIEKLTISQMCDIVTAKFGLGASVSVLSPIIRGRKGEYRKELETYRKQGFVKARVDGKIVSLEDEIPLDKNKKHDIDIFVDKITLKEKSQARLADSLELAAAKSEGLAVAEVDGRESLLLSAKMGCPVCNVSLPEIEPRLFSFNNPAGACPSCHGLGVLTDFEPSLVVPDEELSINEGALAPWETKHFYLQTIRSLAAAYKFSMDKPYKSLPDAAKRLILYGTTDEVQFRLQTNNGASYSYKKAFEGLIPNLRRRYEETTSWGIRAELERYMRESQCPSCGGRRLKPEALAVKIEGLCVMDLTRMSISEAMAFFSRLSLSEKDAHIAERIIKEIRARLNFLGDVGLGYVALDRTAGSLSGGESQRISLATQIGSSLMGVLYILDEPSIGLHQRDNERLLATLKRLRDQGNTVVVVEHDEDTILESDYIVDMGPGAGVHGGFVVSQGTPAEIMADKNSVTGGYLCGRKNIEVPRRRRTGSGASLVLEGCSHNNLKQIDVELPLGKFVCFTGVSGSGKSSLVIDTIYPILSNRLMGSSKKEGRAERVLGVDSLDKVIAIDQSPIGRTPRSNPATYIGLFSHIRDLYAQLPEARLRGYKPGRFSFNVAGGRCEACEGDGMIKIEMHFLPDVYVKCDVCGGARYNRETLEIRYKGKSIADALKMTAEEGLEFFYNIPSIRNKLQTLCDVGLGYVELGQAATTLSGGEAQRVKLAKELSRRSTGRTIYILDEPTTGLHFEDVKKLLEVLGRLVDAGNSLLVIEHNLEVVKCADWIIDLGLEGGGGGGEIIAQGTPEQIAKNEKSHTGRFLKKKLAEDGSRNCK